MALARVLSLGTSRTMELRIEAFNLFNNFNWGDPNISLDAGTFGQINTQNRRSAYHAVRDQARLLGRARFAMKILSTFTLAAGDGVRAVLAAAPSLAHHSFAAEFDASKCREFTGTLTKIEWTNPHGFFHMDVKDADGTVHNWSFQTYALITLRRAGTLAGALQGEHRQGSLGARLCREERQDRTTRRRVH